MTASHRSRPLRDRLARLDDRVVPAAAERVEAASTALASAAARARAALRGDDGAPALVEPLPLARLDERLARRGPLAVLRAVPAAGAALAAGVALAGGLVLLTLEEPPPDRLVAADAAGSGDARTVDGAEVAEPAPTEPGAGSDAEPAPAAPAPAAPAPAEPAPVEPAPAGPAAGSPAGDGQPDTVLGPAEPAFAVAHLAGAAAELGRLAAESPAVAVPALVHLTEHLTPQAAAELVAGVPVRQAVVRVPLGGEQTAVTPVSASRLPEDATAAFGRLAGQLRSRAAADEAAAAGTPPGDPAGQVLRASADLARRQAAALDAGPGCACLVGLLVTGTPEELAALAARPGVAGVEPGPAGVPPEQLALRPVVPLVLPPPAATP